MTKILSIKQIQNKEFANPKDFQVNVDLLQSRLSNLYHRQLIQGATNYGSFLQNKQTVLSDIDAIILADSEAQLIQDQVFQQICNIFKTSKIDFMPVIVPKEDIQSKRSNFSFMQPLKNEKARFIVGEDPVQTYFQNYTQADQIRSLSVVISDYTRQFIEPLIIAASNPNQENLHVICQYVFQGFRDSYRNLINIHSITNDYNLCNSKQNFAHFLELYPNFLSTLLASRLKDLERSYNEYKHRIDFYSQSFSFVDHAKEYQEFLHNITKFAPDTIEFITLTKRFVLDSTKVLTVSNY